MVVVGGVFLLLTNLHHEADFGCWEQTTRRSAALVGGGSNPGKERVTSAHSRVDAGIEVIAAVEEGGVRSSLVLVLRGVRDVDEADGKVPLEGVGVQTVSLCVQYSSQGGDESVRTRRQHLTRFFIVDVGGVAADFDTTTGFAELRDVGESLAAEMSHRRPRWRRW